MFEGLKCTETYGTWNVCEVMKTTVHTLNNPHHTFNKNYGHMIDELLNY